MLLHFQLLIYFIVYYYFLIVTLFFLHRATPTFEHVRTFVYKKTVERDWRDPVRRRRTW